jgi:hypothetical protein
MTEEVPKYTKHIELTEEMLMQGFDCQCGKFFQPNGTGAVNMPFLTRMLKCLPSESMLGGIPPRFHDAAYQLCSAGFSVMFVYHAVDRDVHIFADSKESADSGFLALMRLRNEECKGFARSLTNFLSNQYYNAVKLKGESSYVHKH